MRVVLETVVHTTNDDADVYECVVSADNDRANFMLVVEPVDVGGIELQAWQDERSAAFRWLREFDETGRLAGDYLSAVQAYVRGDITLPYEFGTVPKP